MKAKLNLAILLLSYFFLWYEKASAQAPNWLLAKQIGGTNDDIGNAIALDASGNVYTTGVFTDTVDFDPGAGIFKIVSAGVKDIFICKLDGSGNFVWAKTAGGTGGDGGQSIVINNSGYMFVTGYFNSSTIPFGTTTYTNADITGSTSDIFIAKLSLSPVGMNDVSSPLRKNVSIYPNPSGGKFTVEVKNSAVNALEIYNIMGEIVYSSSGIKPQSSDAIDLSGLHKGIYFVRLYDGANSFITKLVVQ